MQFFSQLVSNAHTHALVVGGVKEKKPSCYMSFTPVLNITL